MKISGLDNLNTNDYNVIKINRNITIIGKTSLNSDMTLLDNKIDVEKRKKVIDIFLSKNKIAKVLNSSFNCVVETIDSKELLIDKEYLTKEIKRDIYSKYYLDRYAFYNDVDADSYEIITSTVDDYNYYSNRYDENGNKVLKMFIPTKNGTMSIENERFLYKLLDDLKDVMLYNYNWDNNIIYEAFKNEKIVYLNVSRELTWFLCELMKKQDDERDKKLLKMKGMM